MVGVVVDFAAFGVACGDELPHAAATSTKASAANERRRAIRTLPRRGVPVIHTLIATAFVDPSKSEAYVFHLGAWNQGAKRRTRSAG